MSSLTRLDMSNAGMTKKNTKRILLGLALLLLPILVGWGVGPFWVRLLDFSLLYCMLALGLNLVVGFAGLLDLGYIAFYGVGAYTYALFESGQFGLHWPVLPVLLLGAFFAALMGMLLGAPTLKLRGDYLAIVTLGFGEIIRLFLNNLDQPVNITNGPQGISGIDALHIGNWYFDQGMTLASLHVSAETIYYLLFLFVAAGLYGLAHRLQHSPFGRAWMAIREDEMAAAAMGLPLRRLKLLAFACGAGFAGLAGGLFAAFQGFVSPESFSLMESVMVLCMVVLGGMGHLPGVCLGAVLLTLLPELLRSWAGSRMGMGLDPANIRMLVFGLAMIATVIVRPQGLWPSRVRAREMMDHD